MSITNPAIRRELYETIVVSIKYYNFNNCVLLTFLATNSKDLALDVHCLLVISVVFSHTELS